MFRSQSKYVILTLKHILTIVNNKSRKYFLFEKETMMQQFPLYRKIILWLGQLKICEQDKSRHAGKNSVFQLTPVLVLYCNDPNTEHSDSAHSVPVYAFCATSDRILNNHQETRPLFPIIIWRCTIGNPNLQDTFEHSNIVHVQGSIS